MPRPTADGLAGEGCAVAEALAALPPSVPIASKLLFLIVPDWEPEAEVVGALLLVVFGFPPFTFLTPPSCCC